MEYKTGDRVEIINYGHAIWQRMEGTDKPVWIDLQPQLVGRRATVLYGEMHQAIEKYSLDIDGSGKISWFSLKQLKLIE